MMKRGLGRWVGLVTGLSVLLLLLLRDGSGAGFQQPDGSAAVVLHNNRGVALMEQLNFEDAAQEFRSVLAADPDFVPALVNLGIALFNSQRYEEAVKFFQDALRLKADQIQAHFMLGLIYRNQDQVEQAVSRFLQVTAQDPHDPSTNYYLGLLYSRQRDYAKAIEYLRRVVEAEPYNASAHYNLAIALLRSEQREEGQAEMEKFRELQGKFGTTTVGLQYLEQGKYSAVIDRLDPYLPPSDREQPSVQVRFDEVARDSGLLFQHAGPGRIDWSRLEPNEIARSVAPYLGSGIAFADYDADGWFDLFIANASAEGSPGGLFRNRGNGSFEDTTRKAGLTSASKTMAALWGDVNNDGAPDLYLVNYGPNVLYQNNGDGTFKDMTSQLGLGDAGWGLSGAFLDYDHDGDLDLLVANFIDIANLPSSAAAFPADFRGADNVLYRNNGDGTFADVSQASGLAGGARKTTAVLATDFDNRRDIDVFAVNVGAPPQLFSNNRDGSFRDLAPALKVADVTGAGAAVADLNKDEFMDLVLPSFPQPGAAMLLNQQGRSFERSLLPNSGEDRRYNAQTLDYDNDGDLDILLVASSFGQTGAVPALRLLENRSFEFADVTAQTGLDRYRSLAARGLSAADYDNDGDLDLAVNVNGAAPLLLKNEGGNQNHWVTVRPRGTNSNQFAIGTKVEIKAGRLWQKMEIYGGHGLLSQSPPVAHFGLGKHTEVDVVRLLWPGGVLQAELGQPAKRTLDIKELDRKGTSCPILYSWNGRQYKFQTDFLGGSAYGYRLSSEMFNYPDSDEYIKLNRGDVALRDGKVAVTLNNQLEEVILYDKVELLAVDHPADYDLYPDEKLLPGPPFADFRLISTSGARPPLSAQDEAGRDVLAALSHIDRLYPSTFRALPFKGYAEEHELILDLGAVDPRRTFLLMHAWIDYADSTSNLAAQQAGLKLTPPYLQVRDPSGKWVTVIERMGFPAGLPKTMTVDLSNRFLSDSREVRLVTNMRIYWDQILVETGPDRRDYRITRVSPGHADLQFYGFPLFFSPDGREPKIYDYRRASATAQWKTHIGGYTRYGDVRPLLQERDDMFVITRSGDQVELFFDASAFPTLPDGWVRDYLVYVVGFGKDMDPNSAAPDYIGPLPFQNMSRYPYGEGERYPDDEAHRKYLQEWNTRVIERWFPDLRRVD